MEGPQWRDLPTEAPTVGQVLPLVGGIVQYRQPLRRPQIALDAVATAGLQAAGASMAGLRHVSTGTCRQDSFGIFCAEPGRLFVVLADGLGSRLSSQLGADLFVEAVGRLVHSAGDRELPGPADLLLTASAWTEKIAANTYELTARDIGFVGLVAEIGPGRAEAARIGDLSAFVLDGDTFIEIFEADKQFINVVEASLPAADAADNVEVRPMPAASLAFATDGLADDIRGSSAVRVWLSACWQTPLAAFAMGDSLRYRRQGSHDDRTGVVVWQRLPEQAASQTEAEQDTSSPAIA